MKIITYFLLILNLQVTNLFADLTITDNKETFTLLLSKKSISVTPPTSAALKEITPLNFEVHSPNTFYIRLLYIETLDQNTVINLTNTIKQTLLGFNELNASPFSTTRTYFYIVSPKPLPQGIEPYGFKRLNHKQDSLIITIICGNEANINISDFPAIKHIR